MARPNPPSPPRCPCRPGIRAVGPEPRLADLPQVLFLGLVVEELHRGSLRCSFSRSMQRAGLVVGLVLGLAAELDQQTTAARAAAA